MLSRNGKDRAGSFPAIARAIGTLRSATLLLVGEVVALDRHEISRFQWLQRGGGVCRARYAVFDRLYVSARDLQQEPLSNRRAELERSVEEGDALTLSRRRSANGLQAFGVAKRRGYEGLVAKRLASVSIEGPKPGLAEGKGASRRRIHCCVSYSRKFQPLKRKQPSVDLLRLRGPTLLSPKLVAQISYTEWTKDRKLSHPVFLGSRDDKVPREVAFRRPNELLMVCQAARFRLRK